MKKHKNRIEIVGAYYLRIVIGRSRFDAEDVYETKSAALRAARRIISELARCPVGRKDYWSFLDKFPIYVYDYDGDMPGVGNEKAKYKIISG